jgi:4'-phosphopantetheinyl transferase
MSLATPASGEVHLWWSNLDAGPTTPDTAIEVLSADELARLTRLRSHRDRCRAMVRRAILRLLLGSYLDLDPAGVPLAAGSRGKPACPSAGSLAFNCSSSAGASLYAFCSGCRIGVDIECRPDGDWELFPTSRYLSDAERAALAGATEPLARRLAAEAWVAKEAVAKAVGAGFTLPPTSIEPDSNGRGSNVRLTGPWTPYASPRWRVCPLGDGVRTIAAVALDGELTGTISRRWGHGALDAGNVTPSELRAPSGRRRPRRVATHDFGRSGTRSPRPEIGVSLR